MRKNILLLPVLLLISLVLISCSQRKPHPVYMDKEMSFGYDLGVITDKGVIGWLSDSCGYMKMDYPADQTWGSVFITVGKIKDLPNKPTVDLTAFKKISFELASTKDDQKLDVGMKDAKDADDGTETRVPLIVTSKWKTYEIDLAKFKSADMNQIFILLEFVFSGPDPQIVYFRNIQFK